MAASVATSFIQPLSTDEAKAASYFCAPEPIKVGTYRPDDTDEELEIRVRVPLKPFWFDDLSGDYQAEGGQLARGKLTVPLDAVPPGASLSFQVKMTFDAGQCVASGMGIHPTETQAIESTAK